MGSKDREVGLNEGGLDGINGMERGEGRGEPPPAYELAVGGRGEEGTGVVVQREEEGRVGGQMPVDRWHSFPMYRQGENPALRV